MPLTAAMSTPLPIRLAKRKTRIAWREVSDNCPVEITQHVRGGLLADYIVVELNQEHTTRQTASDRGIIAQIA